MAEFSGFGAALAIYITSAFSSIAQVRDINGPSTQMDTPEVSHRDSAWKKYAAGMLDGGEVTFDIVYDPDVTTHKAGTRGGLVYAQNNRLREQFKLTFPDASTATTATFYAYVTKVNPKEPMNGALTADVTLKIDGEVTWA